jgi:hypothetical protein
VNWNLYANQPRCIYTDDVNLAGGNRVRVHTEGGPEKRHLQFRGCTNGAAHGAAADRAGVRRDPGHRRLDQGEAAQQQRGGGAARRERRRPRGPCPGGDAAGTARCGAVHGQVPQGPAHDAGRGDHARRGQAAAEEQQRHRGCHRRGQGQAGVHDVAGL